MTDTLSKAYPRLANHLQRWSFASLPTAISDRSVELPGGRSALTVKHDDQTHPLYGGNKVRKLEYILQRARERGAQRIATFGAVGSNHALATAIFAKEFGFDCTCFLAHQRQKKNVANKLSAHLELGTEIVRWGAGVDRLSLYRRYLQNRKVWVIPLGGTCWLGAVGFVNAGLELAAQCGQENRRFPERIYIANGTMGSVAGLSIGLALAGMPTEIHAVRVADNRFVRQSVLDRLIRKTALLLNRLDSDIPLQLVSPGNVVWRDEFYAGGYGAVDEATSRAAKIADEQLGLHLDTTYTAKAMAALLHDTQSSPEDASYMFWNTYSSRPLPEVNADRLVQRGLPQEFERYFA